MNFENKKPAFKPLLPGEQVIVDMKNATQRVCPCGSKYFIQVFTAYTVSALASPTGREFTAQQPVLLCMKCETELGVGAKV